MKTIVTLFLAAVISLLSLSTYAAPRYMILVNAGSSGSRLHLFEYDSAQSLPDIKDILSKEVKPGLSSFATKPQEAANSLKPLLDEAAQVLNKISIDPKTVNIHIVASAGMRLLPLDQQENIYTAIKDYLKKQYVFAIGDIKTIDGKEEGLYGWLAVNYLKGTFQRKEPTVGSIDMGGASTQIAFATKNADPSQDKIALVINQQPYWVFSKSFLNLGQDRAREAMLLHPKAAHCYPKAYSIDTNRVGAFEMKGCRDIYSEILQKQAVKQQVELPQETSFVAYSGIYYAYDFFKVNGQQPLEQRIQEVCSKSWEDLQNAYPNNRYLSTYCANGVYIHELLHHTYQLQETRIMVTNKIQQKEIDWTLGALLYRLVQHQIYWEPSVQIHSVTPTEVVFSWNPAFSANTMLYDVEVRGNGGRVYQNVEGNSIRVSGLQHDTAYSIVLRAKNSVNQVESGVVPVRTLNHKPDELIPDWCMVGC